MVFTSLTSFATTNIARHHGSIAAATPFVRYASLGTARNGTNAILDLARTKIQLEGLHQYGVVAALLMNAALRIISSTPANLEKGEPRIERFAKVAFCISVLLCVVLGGYTTIVFALLGLYSKRALGMNRDEAFMKFFAATNSVRETSFDSFFVMLLCFKCSFLLSVFLRHKENPTLRWSMFWLVLIADLYGWWNWSMIVRSASSLLLIRDII